MPGRRLSALDQARASGSHEAARQHARLNTNQSRPIDVFKVVDQSGIWLMFQPMRNLYGAYIQEGAAPGIIVNANHPLSVRRFTVAHEYGHHVLGHAPVVDDEHSLTGSRVLTPEEAAAQSFAAHFLMPLQLVNTMLRQMNLPLDPGELSPSQAYLLSLNMGSSYLATVNHLRTLNKISPQAATILRKEKPKDIKSEIGRGQRPPQVWADAWLVSAQEAGRTLYPKVEDVLHVALPETPSTGFLWSVEDPGVIDTTRPNDDATIPTHAFLSIEMSSFEGRFPDHGLLNWQHSAMRFGAGGTRHLAFRALRPGRFILRLVKRRPWEQSGITEAFELNLSISPAGTGGIVQGVSIRQQPLLSLHLPTAA